jgi:hypothetical protein
LYWCVAENIWCNSFRDRIPHLRGHMVKGKFLDSWLFTYQALLSIGNGPYWRRNVVQSPCGEISLSDPASLNSCSFPSKKEPR